MPGVGALFLGAGSDLSAFDGRPARTRRRSKPRFSRFSRPARRTRSRARSRPTAANDVARRVKEGWNIIRSTVPAITAGRALLGE